jgi:hypothetical protein
MAGLYLIVTRNVADIVHSPIPAVDPAGVVVHLEMTER